MPNTTHENTLIKDLPLAAPAAHVDLDMPPLFELRDFAGPLEDYLDVLYAQYSIIVYASNLRFWGKTLTVSGKVEADGRDATFWHMITDSSPDHSTEVRAFSLRRCAQLPHVWAVLEAFSRHDPSVCYWRQDEATLMVTPLDFSLVVVLKERTGSLQLTTAYPITAERIGATFDKAVRAWTGRNGMPETDLLKRRIGKRKAEPRVQRVLSLDFGSLMGAKPAVRWESRVELAKRLGISVRALDCCRRHGLPACQLPGQRGCVLFDPHEVDAWLRQRQAPCTTLPALDCVGLLVRQCQRAGERTLARLFSDGALRARLRGDPAKRGRQHSYGQEVRMSMQTATMSAKRAD